MAADRRREADAGSNVDAVTVRLRGPTGAYTWFEINGSQVLGDDGELRFILGTARDVGEREELRSRLRDLDAVYRFADAVAGASELVEVLEVALDALLEATGADRASVLLCDDENVMRFRAWRGLSDEYRAATDGHSAVGARRDGSPAGPRRGRGGGGLRAVAREDRARTKGSRPSRSSRSSARPAPRQVHALPQRAARVERPGDPPRPHDREPSRVGHRAHADAAGAHESREQLATILRAVDEGITVADTTGRLLYANDASARQFGKASVEELLAAPRGEWLEHSSSSTPTASRSSSTTLPVPPGVLGRGGIERHPPP